MKTRDALCKLFPVAGVIPEEYRRLAPVWGAHSVHAEDQADIESLVSAATRTALREGFAEAGSPVLRIARA